MKFISRECFPLSCPYLNVDLSTILEMEARVIFVNSANLVFSRPWFKTLNGSLDAGWYLGNPSSHQYKVWPFEKRAICIYLPIWYVKLIIIFTEKLIHSSKLLYSLSLGMSYQDCSGLFNLAKIQGLDFSVMLFVYVGYSC